MKLDHLFPRSRPRPQKSLVCALRVSLALGASMLCAGTAFAATLVISGTPSSKATAGGAYYYKPTVTGSATGSTLKFTIAHQPAWATFNSGNGTLFGYPQSDGTFSGIVISVSDGHSSATLPTFAITVSGTNPVKISGTPPASATAGKLYSFKPAASDTSGHAVSYTVQNKPAWATFSIATGQLSGTPTSSQVGTYAGIVIWASDGLSRAYLPTFTIKVSAATTSTAATLAQKHPGDVGMGSDPAVVHYENFSEASVAAVLTRYNSYKNTAGMALVADHPTYSPSSHVMQLTAGGAQHETNLYRDFGAGFDELWFRYYVKYEGSGGWSHSGLWFGGANPTLPYPYPHAGTRPTGSDRFMISLEPTETFANDPMDFYNYWVGMHSFEANPTGADAYYGNTLLHDAQLLTGDGNWTCYEIHLKLNPEMTNGTGAVLELWKNDTLVRRFDDTGPYGYWVGDRFCPTDADGTECTAYRAGRPDVLLNQQYRTVPQLKINYIWPEHYNTGSTPSSLRFADMVVAQQRIGCTVPK
jgi:hypothetical protein